MQSERDETVLDFEGSWWLYLGPKDIAIREDLGITATRYYQAIRRLIDDEFALQHARLTVHRLRRMRKPRLAPIAARVGGSDSAG